MKILKELVAAIRSDEEILGMLEKDFIEALPHLKEAIAGFYSWICTGSEDDGGDDPPPEETIADELLVILRSYCDEPEQADLRCLEAFGGLASDIRELNRLKNAASKEGAEAPLISIIQDSQKSVVALLAHSDACKQVSGICKDAQDHIKEILAHSEEWITGLQATGVEYVNGHYTKHSKALGPFLSKSPSWKADLSVKSSWAQVGAAAESFFEPEFCQKLSLEVNRSFEERQGMCSSVLGVKRGIPGTSLQQQCQRQTQRLRDPKKETLCAGGLSMLVIVHADRWEAIA